jgi:single-strand DNA-binding protein
MSSVNKVILVGNLGADPEKRFLPSGGVVTNFRIATSETRKSKETGIVNEHTEWHRVVLFDKLAEISAQYLNKGSQVYVEGKLRTRKWQGKDGAEKTVTEVIADELQFIGSRNSEKQKNNLITTEPTRYGSSQATDSFNDTEIPF